MNVVRVFAGSDCSWPAVLSDIIREFDRHISGCYFGFWHFRSIDLQKSFWCYTGVFWSLIVGWLGVSNQLTSTGRSRYDRPS